jgi:hypothetical protein
MECSPVEAYLVQLERNVSNGERCIAHQRAIIFETARAGHDTRYAEAALERFKGLQETHLAERDRVRGELDDAITP